MTNSVSTTANFSAPGIYGLRLTVDDAVATNSANVTVRLNQRPSAQPSSYSVTQGQSVAITLTGSDPDGDGLTYAVTANPLSGTLSGTAPNLVYTPNTGSFGTDVIQFTVNDGFVSSAATNITIVVNPIPRSRTYTTTEDFQSGQYFASLIATNGQLMLRSQSGAFNNLWVAVSSKGTIVRIDTETGEVKGEYWSAPQGQPMNPSRTTVDLNGSVWAGNREGNSVVHISVADSGLWTDKNHNGVLDTSTGLGDVKPWPNTGGVDSNGGVSTAQDELILHYVKVTASGTRHVSVNSSNNVWVGGTGTRTWDLIDGTTGQIIRHENSIGFGGYGGLIDHNNVIWSSNPLLRWDTSKPLTGANGGNWKGYSDPSYGIGVDSKGNIWVSQLGTSKIMKIAPDGTILGRFYQGSVNAQGVAVDLNDDVWVASSLINGTTVGHLKNDGTFVGNVRVGQGPTGVAVDMKGKIWVAHYNSGNVMRIDPNSGPYGADGVTPIGMVDYISPYLGGNLYNYSDMTGSTLTSFPGQGVWSAVYDSTIPQAHWGPITWNSRIYDDGRIKVVFAASDDGISFGAGELISQPNGIPSAVGRYGKVTVTIERSSGGVGSILDDITIGTAGYNFTNVQPYVSVDAGQNHTLQLPLADQLHASLVHNGFLTYNTNQTFTWSKVSGPGTVTFGNTNAASTSARISSPGLYVLRAQTTLSNVTYFGDVQITAIPVNYSPWVDVGPHRVIRSTNDVLHINAASQDDGLPNGSLTVQWSKVIGPGLVTVTPTNFVSTNFISGQPMTNSADMTFSAPGIYLLQAVASDGLLSFTNRLEVRVQAICSVQAPSGLVQWWPGNGDNSETVRGNNMMLQNGAAFAQAQISYGYFFNGTTNYAKAFEHPNLDIGAGDGLSIEFWIKGASSGRVFGWARNGTNGIFGDYSTANGALTFHLMDTNSVDHAFTVNGAISQSQFQHVAITYDKTTGRAMVYINGILTTTSSIGTFTPRTTGDFYFAGDPQATARFGGLIDDFSLYNRVLDGQEIYDIATATFIGKCPNDEDLAPVVNAGKTILVDQPVSPVPINGTVTDDGLPAEIPLYSEWQKVSGPGQVSFDNPTNPVTSATFSASGIYTLRLYADDGEKSSYDLVEARVNAICSMKDIQGLVAWWSGNNTSADAMGGNPAQRFNGTGFTNGMVGGSFYFNGGNNYAEVQGSSTLDIGTSTNGWTVEMWVNGPTVSGYRGILEWNSLWANDSTRGLHIYQNGGSVRINPVDVGGGTGHTWNGGDVAAGVFDGTWHHIAFTYERGSGLGRVYRDGVMTFNGLVGGYAARTSSDLYFAPRIVDGQFGGMMDEISLYRRALTSQEIYSLYASGSAGKCPSDNNQAPVVYAGSDKFVAGVPGTVTLNGFVSDDGLPVGSQLRKRWMKLSGPGQVTFGSTNTAETSATFSANGIYVLQLTADDGEIQSSDSMEVRVETLCTVANEQGLAAWWPGNGSAVDEINGTMAIFGSGANYGSGKVAMALAFDGTNDFVQLPANTNYDIGLSTNGWTVEMWVNGPAVSGYRGILEWNSLWANDSTRGLHIYQNGGSVRINPVDVGGGTGHTWNGGDVAAGVFDGTWHHIAFTYERGSGLGRVYRDGVMTFNGLVGSYAVRTSSDLYFAPRIVDGQFGGMMDEISLYRRALTSQEIYSLYASGSAGKCPSDNNQAPVVYAGSDKFVTGVPGTVTLNGSVSDDGLPVGSQLRMQWMKLSGPGQVTFSSTNSAVTSATFSTNGIYVLQLTADDGEIQNSDVMEVRVETLCTVANEQGLAAWWPGNGSAADEINGTVATFGSGANYGSGKVAMALAFDGANDFVQIPANTNYDIGLSTNGWTVEMWVNGPTVSGYRGILEWNSLWANNSTRGLHIYQNGGSIRINPVDVGGGTGHTWNGGDVATGVFDGTWHHIAFTYERGSGLGRVYRDGVMTFNGLVGSYAVRTSSDLYFAPYVTDGQFGEMMDEISLYRRALNSQEIYSLYASGSAGKCPSDSNQAPVVYAGSDKFVTGVPGTVTLNGFVSDDGLPVGSQLRMQWMKLSGPGQVTFSSTNSAVTSATFSTNGIYVLQLTADDGEIQNSDRMEVRVETLCTVANKQGLAAWWPGNGSAVDEINGTMATFGSGANYGSGKVAMALAFDGANDFVQIPANTNYDIGTSTNGWTVEMWVNGTAVSGYRGILEWNSLWANNPTRGLHIYQNGGSIRINPVDDGGGTDHTWNGGDVTTGVFDGTWHHIAFTYERGSGLGRVYRDGVMTFTGLVGSYTARTSSDLYFAPYITDGQFGGMMDEISLYRRALNSQEIYSLYASGSAGKCPSDNNQAPVVYAGPTISIFSTNITANLIGFVSDDGLPALPLRINWNKFNAPGSVSFANSNSAVTTATFSTNGIYLLQLTADDGEAQSSSIVEIRVGISCQTNASDLSGLVAWWTANGTSADRITGQQAVLADGTTYAQGKVSTAYQFDGVNDFVQIPASTNYDIGSSTNGWTVEMWVNGPTVSGYRGILEWNSQWANTPSQGMHIYQNGGSIRINPVDVGGGTGHTWNGADVATSVFDGTWHHIAFTYERGSGLGRVYRDGVMTFNGSVGSYAARTSSDLYFAPRIVDGQFGGMLDEISLYNRPLTATEVQGIFAAGAIGKCATPLNTAPRVFAGGDRTVYFPTNTIVLYGAGYDDGLPTTNALTFAWSGFGGTNNVSFDRQTSAVTTVTFTNTGVYTFQLTASDGQFTVTNSAVIAVLPDPRTPPSVSWITPTTGSIRIRPQGTNLTLAVIATDADDAVRQVDFYANGTNVASLTNGPYSVTVSNVFAGNYSFSAVATDFSGLSTTSAAVNVTLYVSTNPPTIAFTSPASGAALEVLSGGVTNVTLITAASDSDGRVVNVQFYQNGVAIDSLSNAPYLITVTNLPVNNYIFTAVATDDDGLAATSAVAVAVFIDNGAPSVSISSPEEAATITAPTAIIGTASSPILYSYEVQYRLKAAEGADPYDWAKLFGGTTSVVDSSLGIFDPTLLLNGIYELQLKATDRKGRTSSTEIQTVVIDRNLKIGKFSLSFSDLRVPVSGVPIEIIRTYDSRDQRANDFGIGWSLDIRNVRLQKTRNLGANWSSSFTSPFYSLDSIQPRRVTVTLAGDKVYQFDSVITPSDQFGFPIESVHMTFTNLPGTYGTLEIDGDNQADVDGFVGYINLINLEDFSTFNPTRFRLTTAEGEVYIVDEKQGLKSLSDRNSNTLLITSAGIQWTNTVSRNGGLGIAFIRDNLGRITNIVDPNGGVLGYSYGTNGSLAAFTDRTTNTTTFAYTNVAFPTYLTTITDPRGVKAIRTEYDDSGRMVRQIDADGNAITFSHDFSNNREIVTDRLGHLTIHEYDDDGNVVRTTDSLGNVTTSTYDGVDNLVQQVDALGNTNRYTYDGNGNKLSETDPLGFTTRYTYGPYRTLTSIKNARGFTTTNRYDTETSALLETQDPLGDITRHTYNGRGDLLTRVDPLGNVISNNYDGLGRITNTVIIDSQRGVLSATAFAFDANGNKLSKTVKRTTPQGIQLLTTLYVYDADNRVVKTINPDGSTKQTVYATGLGKPAVQIDPLGRQTFFSYDDRGNLTNTVFADNASESVSYDAENRKIAMMDRAGRVTFFTNDTLGRLTAVVYPGGAVSNIVYDAIGRIIATVDERGNTNRFDYDPNCGCSGRKAEVIDPLGHVTHYGYDEDANQSSMTDVLNRTTSFIHDALDRQTQVIFPDGTSVLTTYDAIGRRIAETDQASKITLFAYDALGRLTAVTNSLGLVTTYSYDEAGNLISQTDANTHTTTFEYDSMGRRTKRTLPMGQVESYAYDLAGNLASTVDFNGHTTSFGYDSLNRLLSKTPDAAFNAAPITFTYTLTGQRATMTDASGTAGYLYNQRDWVTNKAVQWNLPGGGTYTATLSYAYDAYGNVTNIHSSDANGVNLGYGYDSLNRLATVADAQVGVTTYGYDAVGNLGGYTYPNGVSSVRAYDSLNRLTNLSTVKTGAVTIANYSYTVGLSGHRLTASEGVLVGTQLKTINRTYTYDSIYRLTGEQINGAEITSSLSYTHDAAGNRLTRASTLASVPSTISTYDGNDRLNSDTYDSNGNTVAATLHDTTSGNPQTVADQYDFEDHLINRNNGQITIRYDGDGNRVAKTVAGVTTLYLVDDRNPSGYAQILEELVTSPNTPAVTRVYAYGTSLISQDQLVNNGPSGFAWLSSFYGHDGHGSVRYLTDNSAAVTDTYEYDAFGSLIAQTGNTPNNYFYCGEQFDADLDLYYNRARYLNQDSGRFWTMDTEEGDVEDPITRHRFLYSNANSVNKIDPSGNESIAELEAAEVEEAETAKSVVVNTTRARKLVNAVCKGAKAIDVTAKAIPGIYVIVGLSETYVGSSLSIEARLASHYKNVKALLDAEGTIVKFFPVDVGAAGELGVSEQGLLRTIEQRFLDDVGKANPGKNSLNRIRARSLKKFDAFVKSFCPGS